ncbi:hypothetical protein C2S51_021919 [Perilla frutescens var. frutescens]|nr:hypothetical protein C2S51_021919 [Perilla frutescens var. frutescens]
MQPKSSDENGEDIKMKLEGTQNASINLNRAIQYVRRLDGNKLRKTVSNSLAAQKSRLIKARYFRDKERKVINDLEKGIRFMEEESVRLVEQCRILKLETEELEQVVLLRRHQANTLQMIVEKNKAELERLTEEVKNILLKMASNSSSCSGFCEDEQLGMEEEEQEEDPFINFDA